MEVTDNPYVFGDRAVDRQRLETQNFLFSNYLRARLPQVIQGNVRSILDVGCGEGQLGLAIRESYPRARLVGIDSDPEAIARGRQTVAELGLPNVSYIVGDVETDLPVESYDLIYVSFVLLHRRHPDQIVEMLYNVLNPGGYLWVKDLDPSWATAIDIRSYRKLAELINSGLSGMGGHPEIVRELPGLLRAKGFVDIREEVESYALGGTTPEGQAMLATVLGVFYNARTMISRMHKIPESEIERLYLDVCNAALRSPKELGTERIGNIIARRPRA